MIDAWVKVHKLYIAQKTLVGGRPRQHSSKEDKNGRFRVLRVHQVATTHSQILLPRESHGQLIMSSFNG